MTSDDCIFCRIAAGEIPAQIVRRERGMVAFHDVSPKAPVHLLVIPERHVTSIAGIDGLDDDEKVAMLDVITAVAREHGLEATGYRVTTNHGADGRQSVFHLHWHVMGGAPLSESM
ncbi:MAG: histidine triad nucleotide-binding protein [Thermoleophilia bacterium]|nr:histidine triad nucleotide-binding protein [Thermoleophilia bacterium]